jgi:hypothetical protein
MCAVDSMNFHINDLNPESHYNSMLLQCERDMIEYIRKYSLKHKSLSNDRLLSIYMKICKEIERCLNNGVDNGVSSISDLKRCIGRVIQTADDASEADERKNSSNKVKDKHKD